MLLPVLLFFTIVMIAAAWPITWALSGFGFRHQHPTPEQFDFAVGLSRITIPYLMLISLASLLGGILNSLDKYWVNAAAPILLNVSMIAGLWFFHGHGPDAAYVTARAQAISVTIGGALQLGWLMFACRQGRREPQDPAAAARRRRAPAAEADPPRRDRRGRRAGQSRHFDRARRRPARPGLDLLHLLSPTG